MQSVIFLFLFVQRHLEWAEEKPLNIVLNTLFTFTHLDYRCQMSSGIATVNRIYNLTILRIFR